MRLATSLCLGVIVAASLAGPARPQDTDDWLKVYGVHVDRTPKQSWTGLGIYLGQGIVLTPAHVSGLGLWRRPRVDIAGKIYPTRVLKDGHFHRMDLHPSIGRRERTSGQPGFAPPAALSGSVLARRAGRHRDAGKRGAVVRRSARPAPWGSSVRLSNGGPLPFRSHGGSGSAVLTRTRGAWWA